jgi:hypothetical protein
MLIVHQFRHWSPSRRLPAERQSFRFVPPHSKSLQVFCIGHFDPLIKIARKKIYLGWFAQLPALGLLLSSIIGPHHSSALGKIQYYCGHRCSGLFLRAKTTI